MGLCKYRVSTHRKGIPLINHLARVTTTTINSEPFSSIMINLVIVLDWFLLLYWLLYWIGSNTINSHSMNIILSDMIPVLVLNLYD